MKMALQPDQQKGKDNSRGKHPLTYIIRYTAQHIHSRKLSNSFPEIFADTEPLQHLCLPVACRSNSVPKFNLNFVSPVALLVFLKTEGSIIVTPKILKTYDWKREFLAVTR